MQRSRHAFSLVELSLVLAIMGITLASGLTIATQSTDTSNISATNTRLTAIETALNRYLLANGHLPCPADPTLPISDSKFGILADNDSVNCVATVGGAAITLVQSTQFTHVWTGMIPVRTLGLADEAAFDGYGRRIVYAVDDQFTTTLANFRNGTGTIRIDATSGGANISTTTLYVLLSGGKDGHGVFPLNGSARLSKNSSDTDQLLNCHCNAAGTYVANAATDGTFISKSATTTFDDIIRYKDKSGLLASSAANALTDTTPCRAADDVVNAVGGNDCATATNAAACTILATQIHSICFQN